MAENGAPPPHVAIIPCAGMGHLIPLLRLARMLSSRGCLITVITPHPTVSAAESNHLSAFFAVHSNIRRLEFRVLPHEKSGFTNEDPFWIQVEAVGNSIHLLRPLLSSLSPPLNAVVADFPICNSISELASDDHLCSFPVYTFVPTSARFFSLMTRLPHLTENDIKDTSHIDVPGLGPVPLSILPPPMLNPNHFFSANICTNVSSLTKVHGVLMNTYDSFEPEAVRALRSNVKTSIFPIGPLEPFENDDESHNLPWLDEQDPESVVFVSFGSRTALSKDQIRELSLGLEMSGCRFLWVLKANKVDKEDKEGLEEIVGKSFLERTKEKGVVVKRWLNQDRILRHPAIGGFMSHSGWNSAMESARIGVPVLCWPQGGDHGVNAEAVEKSGLGLWVREWGCEWDQKLVERGEIAEKIRELMMSRSLRDRAMEVKKAAHKARERSGSSEGLLLRLIEALKMKERNP